ncbi:hypothetical protein KVT40_002275 [Elsinoe batatas]|uniref:HNH nuclease domain-containing protein n=1 Tax=Elsinoe batatas TaxID=2601811 RepID=A0A8K0L661_9PEZI|nr:hypothetical protein KVT40_002275 [Elsinoe batatas]
MSSHSSTYGAMDNIKPPPTIPSGRPKTQVSSVQVQHPGYAGINILLRLPAVDSTASPADDGRVVCGIHHPTLHTACAIVADNRFDGYLSTRKQSDSPGRIDREEQGVIPAGVYYYHVPRTGTGREEESGPYPVVPSFDDWSFPDGPLPPIWTELDDAQAEFSTSDATEDPFCMVTGHQTEIQVAHVVPSVKADWFTRNAMGRFCADYDTSGRQGLNDRLNTLRLRSDIHQVWDRSKFALVPKRDDRGKVRLVSHVLGTLPDFLSDYHNRATIIPQSHCSSAMLFARFALQILAGVLPFFPLTVQRAVKIRSVDGSFRVQNLDRFAIPAFRPRSRTPSPRKKRFASPPDETSAMDEILGSDAESESHAGSLNDSVVDESKEESILVTEGYCDDAGFKTFTLRGRKRQRSDR